MKNNPNHLKKYFKSGLTLIEIMVSIFIFILALVAVMSFITQNYRNYQFGYEQSLAVEEARKAIDNIVKEIREAKPSDTGNYPIAEANNESFTFYSDIDRDIVVEKVRYFRQSNSFKKGIINPSGTPLSYNPANEIITTLSNNLITTTTPTFIYYNGNYPGDTSNNPLVTPADVTQLKLVHIHLIINVNPLSPPSDYILDTFVQPRNLKENL